MLLFRLLLFLLTFTFVHAEIVVEKIAGADHLTGDFAWRLGYHTAGTAWDTSDNAYFAADDRIWKLHPDSTVEAVAGAGQHGYGGDGGPALQAKLAGPRDVRRDAAGNLYFVDAGNWRIRRVDAKGVITTVLGNGVPWVAGMDGTGQGDRVPYDGGNFAVDSQGVVYVVDRGNMVRRVDLAGNATMFAGGAPSCGFPYCSGAVSGAPATQSFFTSIRGVAVHPSTGELYIFEGISSIVGQLHQVSKDGILTRTGGIENAFFSSMGVDKDGAVYITRVSPNPTIEHLGSWGPVTRPGLSTLLNDASGRVVYADGTVVRLAEDGSALQTYPDAPTVSSADGTAANEAVLNKMRAIAVSHAGEVYFAELVTCSVRKIDRDGKLRTVAGSGTCGTRWPDLPVIDALAFDTQDRLWVRAANRTFTFTKDVFSGTDIFAEVALPREVALGDTIAFDSRGRLYSGDANSVVRQELDGSVGVTINGLTSLGTDTAGNVYYGNPDGVFRFEDDGRATKVLSGAQSTARFTVDSRGHIWRGFTVQDEQSQRVFASSPVAYSAMAPTGDLYGLADGQILKLTGFGKSERPVISGSGVVNAASYVGGSVAPGELVSIFGSNFGVTELRTSQPLNNRVPMELGPMRVLFNGQPGAITAVTPTQINVFVPSGVAGQKNVNVAVQVDDAFSQPVTVPVADTLFGLASLDASGKGQGAILNGDGSVNGRGNPAAPGSIIVLFGTGEGSVTPQAVDGALNVTTPYPVAKTPLSVKIGGQAAEVVFQGGAPTLPIGVYQINARIPQSTPAGDVLVEVVAGGGATSKPVTVAVQ